MVRVLFLLLCVGLAGYWILFFCAGCAALNTNSAERRAGTYKAGSTIEIDPVNHRIYVDSSGDDRIKLQKATIGGSTIEGLEVDMNRSQVVKAQGSRARDITELMGQDVQMNQIWGDTWLGTMDSISNMVGTMGPAILQYRKAQASQQAALQEMKLQMLEAAITRQAVPATAPSGVQPEPLKE